MTTELNTNFIAALRAAGAVKYNELLPETKVIENYLLPDERLLGVVYGRYKQQRNAAISRGVLVATDQRVLLINKKPLFLKHDEFGYRAISGVDFSWVAIMGTVTLQTRLGDIHIRTFNKRCAETFVRAIESNLAQSK
ncbi:PH domain-containing protein [Aeromicrobium sp.]|nr:PH domain-containing protein [Candidatus Saccharibacteria bacterium]